MSFILFAGGFYAPLDGLCFLLATYCGYFIARHFHSINHKSSGLRISVCVGVAIGILLNLHDPNLNPRFFRYYNPENQRIIIGFVGACLGYFFCHVQARQRMKTDKQTTINNENIDQIERQAEGSQP